MKGVTVVIGTLIGVGLVKLYGEYKYNSGLGDGLMVGKVVLEAQKNLVDILLDNNEEAEES